MLYGDSTSKLVPLWRLEMEGNPYRLLSVNPSRPAKLRSAPWAGASRVIEGRYRFEVRR